MTIHAANEPETQVDFLRAVNIGYQLFDEFSGDALSHTDDLSTLKVYAPEILFPNHPYRPLNRNDLATAMRYIRSELWHGHSYRIYARYHVTHNHSCIFRKFDKLEVIDKLALVGPGGPAVKLGEVEL